MSIRWTPERRERQAELIRAHRPWERSTGPRTVEGKARAARNAYKGGLRAELRQLHKALTELLRDHRDLMDKLLR